MATAPSPEEREKLLRFAEWSSANAKTLATISKVAEDALRHAHVVQDAIEDPNGRRVADLVRLVHRLEDLMGELERLPSVVTRHKLG